MRDRGVDALRALAVAGVVCGHWLVTALVADSGTIRVTSPLKHLPELAPASWLLQTMALFFLVGGMVAARSTTPPRLRLIRLLRPLPALAGVWAVVVVVLLACGADPATVAALAKLVWSPLWFLPVYAALIAATPLVARLHPGWPVAVVAAVDLARFGFDAPGWVGWINVGAAWLVPFCVGLSWRRFDGRTLLVAGAVATGVLITVGGYPAAMVGVPGAAVSNQSPPTLAAVTFGLAQTGAALLLLGPLRRLMRRPALWGVVAAVNVAAMTVYVWHQTALVVVTALALPAGPLAGLHTVPGDPGWVAARLGWLPLFALALVVGLRRRNLLCKGVGP
ncbi:acyltransferase family protein [Herbidospora sp. NBRC 101105]|uniref:acyltransferase family protein n=1 Tax=Herbidospora sp. NBRC 101105 TaxID=3032195 RepID=UPI0024A3AF7C|nr:acyltransferase family protein [Herbidospora sp. NBRC 101105]GLX97117.1 acyltransferase [Herbidospora sp. NBRC 101105]